MPRACLQKIKHIATHFPPNQKQNQTGPKRPPKVGTSTPSPGNAIMFIVIISRKTVTITLHYAAYSVRVPSAVANVLSRGCDLRAYACFYFYRAAWFYSSPSHPFFEAFFVLLFC